MGDRAHAGDTDAAVAALTYAEDQVVVLLEAIRTATFEISSAGVDPVSACLSAEQLRSARDAAEHALRDAQEVLDRTVDAPLLGKRPASGIGSKNPRS